VFSQNMSAPKLNVLDPGHDHAPVVSAGIAPPSEASGVTDAR